LPGGSILPGGDVGILTEGYALPRGDVDVLTGGGVVVLPADDNLLGDGVVLSGGGVGVLPGDILSFSRHLLIISLL